MSSGPPYVFTGQPTAEHERVLASLSGQHIAAVRYLLLTTDNGEVEDWDFVRWHRATMGVSLTLTSGAVYTVTWVQYPWQFGVQVFPGPPRARDNGTVDVSTAPQWAPLRGQPIDTTAIYDPAPPPTDGPQPVSAIRITTAGESAWIAAAESTSWLTPDSEFWWGAQEISIIFDLDTADTLGIT